jgi:glycerophosphoryl diester phosphodiesterase
VVRDTPVDPVAGRLGRPLAVAHRGDPIPLRENTVPSIRSAIEVGADIVEIDVKTTRDGVSVVLHDDSLVRLWGVDRDIRTLTAAEVADVGDGTTRIPTLDAVLALFSGTACAVMVDMDSGEWAAAAQAATRRAVAAGVVRPGQGFGCGHVDGMRQVRAADADARIFLSWGEAALDGPPPDELVAELRPEAFNPYWRVLDLGGRDWAAARGIPVSCWTVDEPAVMRQVIAAGVDAVISNDIRALLAVIAERVGEEQEESA